MLFIIFSFLFSCRKENINGTYVEIDDSTRTVTYYKVQLDCNTLVFNHVNKNIFKSYAMSFTFTPVYDDGFSYTLYGDSFKDYKFLPINILTLNNTGYQHVYNLGKIKFYKNKLIITGAKYSIKEFFFPFSSIHYSDTVRYTKIYYKTKFMSDYVKFIK